MYKRQVQVSNETCPDANDGIISVTALAGTGVGPYTYDFGSGPSASTSTITGLSGSVAGTNYSVTITDANGCTVVLDTQITEPTPIVFTAGTGVTTDYNGFSVSCFGSTDGAAAVVHTGGSAPISYLWDINTGAQTTATATGLGAGTYCVTLTDANGCSVDTCFTLTEPTPLTMSATGTGAGCNGSNGGTIAAIPSGGVGPYTYAIDSNGTISPYTSDSTWTNLNAGTYTVYVQDANGCGPVQQLSLIHI